MSRKPQVIVNSDTRNNEAGWPKEFTCSFLEPGLVSYEDVGAGVALLRKETIDKMLPTIIGKPLIIRHHDVTPADFKDKAVGYVTRAWYDAEDGWYKCSFLAIDDEAKRNAQSGESVSCSFNVHGTGPGGEYHAIKYDEEIMGGEFTHLALVPNPRYEDCRIYANSREAKIMLWGKDKQKRNELVTRVNTNFDAMSPLQRDTYLSSLSESGLQELLEGEGYSEDLKKAVTRHQEERAKQKEEELLGISGKDQKNKKNAQEDGMDPKATFVTDSKGNKLSVDQLLSAHNAKVAADEAAEAAKNNAKDNATKLHDAAIAAVQAWQADPTAEKKALARTAVDNAKAAQLDVASLETEMVSIQAAADQKAAEAAEAAKRANAKKPDHFANLNNRARMSEEILSAGIATLDDKVKRGAELYGSSSK